MTNHEFIDTIQKSDDVQEHYEHIRSWVFTDHKKVISIFNLIPKDWNTLLYNMRLRALYQSIIDLVCKATNKNSIETASILFGMIERRADKLKIASLLASFHNDQELLSEIIRNQNTELLVLLMHEFVSRGSDLRRHHQHEYLETIHKNGEFNVLCLYPLEQERENKFPVYSAYGVAIGRSYGFSHEVEYTAMIHPAVENIQLRPQIEIVEAIDHWTNESGGMSIGYRGRMPPVNGVESLIKSIPELSLSNKVKVKYLDPASAYQRMFDASSNGAAYSQGNLGAYGRLKSWKSLHRMMSDENMTSNVITSALMNHFQWLEFNTNEWFINEWCDFGLMCIDTRTGEFGLIAGTDTD